ncbi:tetraspanin-9 [Synchiropus splendidus]|uniref:tetraspanin-9 n=1 Tax=Synchiropus splendidus TaxID=270530 RepID=UPI00237E850C|nr:tetraspanin-9 [Synchiropus splendidus]
MAQVNTCLKRTFTVFNIILALIGAAIITLGILTQVMTRGSSALNVEDRYFSLIVLYIIGGATLGIAFLGIYGSNKENYAAMVVYLVLMVCGTLAMLRIGIPTAAFRPKLEGELEKTFRRATPLNEASEEVQDMMNNVQSALHCCGLFSADDWNQEIPDSCSCDPEGEDECRLVDYMSLLRKKRSIYSQSCLPLIMPYFVLAFDIVIGVAFSNCVLVLMGLILSAIIIHQMRHSKTPATRLSVPAVFTHMPPKYQELQNPPSY